MSTLQTIITGVIASIIATLITNYFLIIRDSLKNRDKFLKFLKMNQSKRLIICYGHPKNKKDYVSPVAAKLPSQGFDYGDTNSTLEVYARFSNEFKNKLSWISTEIPYSDMKDNIICVGGPKWNKTTEKMLGVLGSPFYYLKNREGLIEKRKNHHSENLHPYKSYEKSKDEVEITDYGCLIYSRNGASNEDLGAILIVSGYSTFGVLIAAEALKTISKKEINKHLKPYANDRKFAILVKGTLQLKNGRIADKIRVEIMDVLGEQDFRHEYDYKYES